MNDVCVIDNIFLIDEVITKVNLKLNIINLLNVINELCCKIINYFKIKITLLLIISLFYKFILIIIIILIILLFIFIIIIIIFSF